MFSYLRAPLLTYTPNAVARDKGENSTTRCLELEWRMIRNELGKNRNECISLLDHPPLSLLFSH